MQIVGPMYLAELADWARETVSAREYPWSVDLRFDVVDGPKLQVDCVVVSKAETPTNGDASKDAEGRSRVQGKEWHARGELHLVHFSGEVQEDREKIVTQAFLMTGELLKNVLPHFFEVDGETMQGIMQKAHAIAEANARMGAGR